MLKRFVSSACCSYALDDITLSRRHTDATLSVDTVYRIAQSTFESDSDECQFLDNYPFLKTETLISASVGTVFGLRIQKMKPNTSALDMGGCSSWLLARAKYRELYT
jgi:hypothetical protein